MNKLPSISIIIPCRNEERYISKNIDSILNQDYTGQLEVLIVDGMSDDNTREIVKQYNNPNVRLIDNPHQFTPHALNIGVDHSKGDIFIILGGHAFLDKSFVSNNIKILQTDKSVGCAGGQILNIYENETGEIISKAMSSIFGVGNATFRTGGQAGYIDTVAFGAYYKKVHYEIGRFDEDLVRNQDDEYNYKIVKAGYKIYFDPSIISHYNVRGSLKKLFKQYYQYGYWKVYVNVKHKTVTTVRQMIPLFFVLGLIAGAILSLLIPYFIWAFVGGISLYVLMALFFGFKTAKNSIESLKVATIFPILHFSYGWGYLIGIINFIILRKKPSKRSKETTRA